jgi:hypothetical protein
MGRLKRLFFRSGNPEPPDALSRLEVLSNAQSEQVFSKSTTKSSPNALSNSVLNRVPLDILVYIMDYLPSVSAVAFSLSCMHLKHSLGTDHFAKVSSSDEDTIALLTLLAMDLPDHIVCFPCKRLHSIKNFDRYNSSTYSTTWRLHTSLSLPACVIQDQRNKTFVLTNRFGATGFKMAIKRYHQQTNCADVLKMMSSKETTTTVVGNYVRQFREEFRVVQGRLMQRIQSVNISRKSSTPTSFEVDPPDERICPHLNLQRSLLNIDCGLKQCLFCRTEYRIDLRHYEGHGLAMFLTRWKDLGPGLESEVWIQHLMPTGNPSFRLDPLSQQASAWTSVRIPIQLEDRPREGEISFAFGDSADFNLDSLLSAENEAELFRVKSNTRYSEKFGHP